MLIVRDMTEQEFRRAIRSGGGKCIRVNGTNNLNNIAGTATAAGRKTLGTSSQTASGGKKPATQKREDEVKTCIGYHSNGTKCTNRVAPGRRSYCNVCGNRKDGGCPHPPSASASASSRGGTSRPSTANSKSGGTTGSSSSGKDKSSKDDRPQCEGQLKNGNRCSNRVAVESGRRKYCNRCANK